jgi:hypothetical protein
MAIGEGYTRVVDALTSTRLNHKLPKLVKLLTPTLPKGVDQGVTSICTFDTEKELVAVTG